MADDTTTTADTAAPAPMTDEQYQAMQQQVTEEAARRAAIVAEARATKLKPLTDLIASDAWATFRSSIGAATVASIGEAFYDQVKALDVISANLAGRIS